MTAEKLSTTCLLTDHDDAEIAQGDLLLEEKRLVSGVGLDPLLECFVLNERIVRSMRINGGETAKQGLTAHAGRDVREHHQSSSLLVGKLLRAVPLFPDPLLVEEQLVVVISDRGGGEGPWPFETRTIRVAAAEGMSTGEGDDFLVVESVELKVRWLTGSSKSRGHTPYGRKSGGTASARFVRGKDKMALTERRWSCARLASGRRPSGVASLAKPSMRPGRHGILGPPISCLEMSYLRYCANARSQTDLDGSDTTESPEIAVAYPLELLLYLLHNATSDMETIVGTVRGFRLEAHGSIVAVFENQRQHYRNGG